MSAKDDTPERRRGASGNEPRTPQATGAAQPFAFDDVLMAQGRLAIVSALVVPGRMDFVELRSLLGMTAGNLSVHAGKLEAAGYIRIDKSFVANRPRTVYTLTAAGRKALLAHVERLSRIVDDARRQ